MKRYFDLNKLTDNNYCDIIDESYMVEIPNDGKPYGQVDKKVVDISETHEYLAQKALDREMEFKSNFFEITGYGWYRKQPKGYSSAIESLNTVFNAVSVLDLLPMDYIIFYTKPDFTNESQCTDEWLIENSFKNQEMTVEQFGLFYKTAITIWNMQEH